MEAEEQQITIDPNGKKPPLVTNSCLTTKP
jgi:hypothetical protein